MIDRTLLTATDFIGVRAALIAELGNDAAKAVVLTRIFYRADERWREAVEVDGEWWWRASVPTIAEETGLAETQVQRIVQSLAESQHIERVKHRIGGVSDHTYSYRVICGIDPANSQHHHPSNSTDLPSMQTVKKVERAPELGDFEKFYAMWPRKAAKPAALRAWKAKVKAGIDPRVMLAGAATYKRWAAESRQDPKFVPYPATWINSEGWNNQLIWPGSAPVQPAGPRRLTAAEENLIEFERTRRPEGREVVQGTVVLPLPHHARVEYRVLDPQDTTGQVYILCPECQSEWGWADDTREANDRLAAMAAEHNVGRS